MRIKHEVAPGACSAPVVQVVLVEALGLKGVPDHAQRAGPSEAQIFEPNPLHRLVPRCRPHDPAGRARGLILVGGLDATTQA